MSELRQANLRREEPRNYTADDEAEYDTPRRRLVKPRMKHPGVKRKSAAENTLSVVVLPITFYSYSHSFSETCEGTHGDLDP